FGRRNRRGGSLQRLKRHHDSRAGILVEAWVLDVQRRIGERSADLGGRQRGVVGFEQRGDGRRVRCGGGSAEKGIKAGHRRGNTIRRGDVRFLPHRAARGGKVGGCDGSAVGLKEHAPRAIGGERFDRIGGAAAEGIGIRG